jgi:DNA-binding NarL/FixJ family response regulator
VTQEPSADIVKEAIGLRAMNYVIKTKVQSELLKAIDSVLERKQFIGSGLWQSVSGAESRQGTAIPSAC